MHRFATVFLMSTMICACTQGYPQGGSKKHTYNTDYSTASADQGSNMALKKSMEHQQNINPKVSGSETTTTPTTVD